MLSDTARVVYALCYFVSGVGLGVLVTDVHGEDIVDCFPILAHAFVSAYI